MTINNFRIVAQGQRLLEGINFDDIFALGQYNITNSFFIAYGGAYKYFKVFQIYENSELFNSKLQKKIYVEQPSYFISHNFHDYKLFKHGMLHFQRFLLIIILNYDM